jgi:hypothetical protein
MRALSQQFLDRFAAFAKGAEDAPIRRRTVSAAAGALLRKLWARLSPYVAPLLSVAYYVMQAAGGRRQGAGGRPSTMDGRSQLGATP